MSAKRPRKIPTPDFINAAPQVSESPEPDRKPQRLNIELTDEQHAALFKARGNTRKTFRVLISEAMELHPDIAAAMANIRKNTTDTTDTE